MISEKKTPLLGHEKAEMMLARAISTDRVFPTWIFCGPFGVGKSTLAHKFAVSLLSGNIPQGDSLDVDEDDPTYKAVNHRTHPDFFVLEQSEEAISIDQTRTLLLKIRKTPTLSQWRVLILENASSLNKNIYNSLLKILEDPPMHTVIIMICNALGAIPQTLLSRAAKINFQPINTLHVKKVLEDMKIEEAERLAQLANGSVGYALYLHKNNGIEIYDNLLQGFFADEENYKKTLKYIVTNNVCDNFRIVKGSILRILKIYTDILTDTVDENCEKEISVLRQNIISRNICVNEEMAKILGIISMVNKCEPWTLDRHTVVMNVFEQFFARES